MALRRAQGDIMRKFIVVSACALALALAPAMAGKEQALAIDNWVKGLIGGVIAGAVIGSIVRAGQNHCHGQVCHAHGYAQAYHYHDAYGNILYQNAAPVYSPPPPQMGQYPEDQYQEAGEYPEAHYDYCFNRFRSYDLPTNSYQPFGNVPRRECVSPYMN
jgi:hypothetical protein